MVASASDPTHAVPADAGAADVAAQLIAGRRHLGPRHLVAPGPDAAALRRLLVAAAAAPDHGRLRPWRFLVLGPRSRARLGEAFAAALLERDPAATPAQQAEARAKADRGAVLLLAVLDLRADNDDVAPLERAVSLGAAVQNLLLAAHAHGWGSGLLSGRATRSAALRSAFGLAEGEHAVCFVALGTPARAAHAPARPSLDEVVRWLD
jgi:nitroreductase